MPDSSLGRSGATDREWLWWCSECERHTEKAPCEHCGAPHDVVLVVPPGEEPHDELLSVDDYDWPKESYA